MFKFKLLLNMSSSNLNNTNSELVKIMEGISGQRQQIQDEIDVEEKRKKDIEIQMAELTN